MFTFTDQNVYKCNAAMNNMTARWIVATKL